jgi:hypothetical protein
MQIFYCSECRTRVSDLELEQGRGQRIEDGVLCHTCARGVGHIDAVKPGPSLTRQRRLDNPASGQPQANSLQLAVIVGCSILVGMLVVVMIFLLRPDTEPAPKSAQNAGKPVSPPAVLLPAPVSAPAEILPVEDRKTVSQPAPIPEPEPEIQPAPAAAPPADPGDLLARTRRGGTGINGKWGVQTWLGKAGRGGLALTEKDPLAPGQDIYRLDGADEGESRVVFWLKDPPVSLRPGKNYEFRVRLKTENAKSGVNFIGAIAGGGVKTVSTRRLTGTREWETLRVSFKVDKQCSPKYFAVDLRGSGTAWVSRIELLEK